MMETNVNCLWVMSLILLFYPAVIVFLAFGDAFITVNRELYDAQRDKNDPLYLPDFYKGDMKAPRAYSKRFLGEFRLCLRDNKAWPIEGLKILIGW